MASGFGLNGGRGRCFPFWQEFQRCYVLSADPHSDDSQVGCKLHFEDYRECLYHEKELARAQIIVDNVKATEDAAKAKAENPPSTKHS